MKKINKKKKNAWRVLGFGGIIHFAESIVMTSNDIMESRN
jgi:hypothetical protein